MEKTIALVIEEIIFQKQIKHSVVLISLWDNQAVKKGDLAHLALPGATFAVRVTPRAKRPGVVREDGVWKIGVTAPPEDGRANAAVAEALAHALGVAKGRLVLVRGATARDKVFRLV